MNITPTPQQQKIDITNCDREPIHIIEQSQQHGVILTVNYQENKILQASSNAINLLGFSPQELVGNPLEKLFSEEAVRILYSKIEAKQNLYPREVIFKNQQYLAIPHITEDEKLVIDIEPFGETLSPILFQEELTKILKEIKDTDPVKVMCHQAVSLIKDLYGYDRVMMYHFDDEWNGKLLLK